MVRKIVSGISLIGIYTLFFHGIPLDILIEWSIGLSLLGGALFTVVLFIFFIEDDDGNELEDPEKTNWAIPKLILTLLSFFAFGITLIVVAGNRESNELKEYGVIGKARVVDGSSMRLRRSRTYKLEIIYYTLDETTMRSEVSVSQGQYERTAMDQVVPIIFSSRYPNMVRIFRSEDEQRQYLKDPAE